MPYVQYHIGGITLNLPTPTKEVQNAIESRIESLNAKLDRPEYRATFTKTEMKYLCEFMEYIIDKRETDSHLAFVAKQLLTKLQSLN